MNREGPANIMIVGEDSHFCYLMRSYVRRSAHKILFSYPGEKVLEVVQQERPDVIVLDVDLQAMGGWNLLRELKNNQVTAQVPVVICSWQDEKEHGAQEGASVYLRMPILYGDFLSALDTIGVQNNYKAA